MRVAVVSDMHGNAVAFDAVLEDIRELGIDRIVCLGDALQGGPQPARVAARLRQLGCPVVIGNADALLLEGEVDDGEEVTEPQLAVREWSLAQLGDEGRALIEQFQSTIELELPGERRLLCFHASPASFHDILLPSTSEEEVRRMLGPYLPGLLTGGHTHLQQIRRLGDSLFFNPGSVGLAYDHQQTADPPRADPWAEYAILTCDDETFSVEFRRVPYDVAALLAVIAASGMPYADVLAERHGGGTGV
jgi:putative phosphoesterase